MMGNISKATVFYPKTAYSRDTVFLRWAGIWIRQEVIWYAAVQKLHSRTGCVVFEVDHYVRPGVYTTILWDLNITEKQMDNPAGCKLGKWLNRQTDERLVRSSEYTALVKAHNDLHHFATLSWQAKEDGNTEKALAYFNNTYGAFMEYDKALKHLQQRMKELGYNTDTQIAAFGGR